jgi:hypothetical protein
MTYETTEAPTSADYIDLSVENLELKADIATLQRSVESLKTSTSTPTEPASDPTVDERIAQAEADGNFGLAGTLKLAKFDQVRQADALTVEGETLEQIREAEDAGDWGLSGRLKAATLHAQDAPEPDLELDTQIAEAQAAGDWSLSGRLKLQQVGVHI